MSGRMIDTVLDGEHAYADASYPDGTPVELATDAEWEGFVAKFSHCQAALRLRSCGVLVHLGGMLRLAKVRHL
jgi:hypothetical protein